MKTHSLHLLGTHHNILSTNVSTWYISGTSSSVECVCHFGDGFSPRPYTDVLDSSTYMHQPATSLTTVRSYSY
jgi:hypothetical protein